MRSTGHLKLENKFVAGSWLDQFLHIVVSACLVFGLGASAHARDGKTIFQQACTACHSIGKGRLVGPDLAGVTTKRQKPWLKSFIKSSSDFIATGDAEAKKIFEEFNKFPMPNQALSDAELDSVIDFIASESANAGPAGGGAAAAVVSFTPDDVAKGMGLFQGTIGFKNGGAACNSCHTVNSDKAFTGGALAKDLTGSFANLKMTGFAPLIKSAPFPMMQKAFSGKDVTDDEIHALAAFLNSVDLGQGGGPGVSGKGGTGGYLEKLVGLGLLFMVGLLAFFAIVWRGRKQGSVNQEMFDRQLKSSISHHWASSQE